MRNIYNTNLENERKYSIYKNPFLSTYSLPYEINPDSSLLTNYFNLLGYKNNTIAIYFSENEVKYEINIMLKYHNQIYKLNLITSDQNKNVFSFGGNSTILSGYVFGYCFFEIKNIHTDKIRLSEFILTIQA